MEYIDENFSAPLLVWVAQRGEHGKQNKQVRLSVSTVTTHYNFGNLLKNEGVENCYGYSRFGDRPDFHCQQ